MRITINGLEVAVMDGSLSIDDALGERSTASFVVMTDTTVHYQQGQPVEVYDDAEALIYAGVIDKPTEKQPTTNVLMHSISCKDWHYLADKRILAKAYENMLAGDIVRDIVATKLVDEGIFSVLFFTWEKYQLLTWAEL